MEDEAAAYEAAKAGRFSMLWTDHCALDAGFGLEPVFSLLPPASKCPSPGMPPFQVVNHMPGSDALVTKDGLLRSLNAAMVSAAARPSSARDVASGGAPTHVFDVCPTTFLVRAGQRVDTDSAWQEFARRFRDVGAGRPALRMPLKHCAANLWARKPVRGVSAHACAGAPWVRAIGPEDIYRRMIAAGLAGGYTRFVSEIVNAKPAALTPPVPADKLSLSSRLDIPVGDARGIGSNVLAFGQAATGERGGVLFGNPHWYWGGPDRFYQAHLTLPGKLDAAGVSFLGIPVIMIGFNNDVAWSHTVSAARRFGLFDLALDPADPTRYLVDGRSEPMQAQPLAVAVRRPDGSVDLVRRTLYRTRFGPVVDLGARNPALAWSAHKALAIRDINADNPRIFRNFFRWDQARSLDEFMAIQREETAMPWVNTAAIGRGDGRAWYADIGAVPGVGDELRSACATPLSKALAALDPAMPVLDGSRSTCEWQSAKNVAQPGTMAADRMPGLLREDYVANMNDSYWLTNPEQPLTGFASILGGEGQPLSMRGQEGHRIAHELANAGATSAKALADRVMQKTLEARASTADRFKVALLDGACAKDQVDIRRACEVLRRWPDRADANDRGALLWDAFWTRVQKIPATDRYAQPFSASAPVRPPSAIRASDPRVALARAGAVEDMARKGWALDMPLGQQRFARSEGRKLPLFGGCDAEGYFTVACANDGDYTMDDRSHGNTYLQVCTSTGAACRRARCSRTANVKPR